MNGDSSVDPAGKRPCLGRIADVDGVMEPGIEVDITRCGATAGGLAKLGRGAQRERRFLTVFSCGSYLQAGGTPGALIEALVTHYVGNAQVINLLRQWLQVSGPAGRGGNSVRSQPTLTSATAGLDVAKVDALVHAHVEHMVQEVYSVDRAARFFENDSVRVRPASPCPT